jgi:hypothetical protein
MSLPHSDGEREMSHRSLNSRILLWLYLFFSLSVSRAVTQSMFLFGTILTALQQGHVA